MVTILLLLIIYSAFISLGIPDGVLGVAWPEIRTTFGMPLEAAGYLSMIAAIGGVFSSFTSGHFIKKFGTGVIVCVSAALTGFAMLGFAFSPNYFVMALCFIPFGIGAGGVDTALNDYVSRHFTPRHMNWLHACWGIGAFTGPLLMTAAIVRSDSWRTGYIGVAIIQLTLFITFLLTMKLWKIHKSTIQESFSKGTKPEESPEKKKWSLFEKLNNGRKQILHRKGLLAAMLFFLFYTGVEAGLGLWSASYFREIRGASKTSAGIWISGFFGCITIGRIIVGLIVDRIGTKKAIRIGQIICVVGFVGIMLPFHAQIFCPVGLSLIGLGLAPMYPCMMHDSPKHFGLDFSQYAIGYQMGMANIGFTLLPFLIGALASATALWVVPIMTTIFFIGTVVMFNLILQLPDLLKDNKSI